MSERPTERLARLATTAFFKARQRGPHPNTEVHLDRSTLYELLCVVADEADRLARKPTQAPAPAPSPEKDPTP